MSYPKEVTLIHRKKFSLVRNIVMAIFTVVLMLAVAVGQAGKEPAVKEKVLHSFGSGTDGLYPFAAVILDSSGNLWGTTWEGGTGPCNGGCGIAFELTPGSKGQWTENILYNFQGRPSDAGKPSASLILDAQGNLYGTARYGGPTSCPKACGAVFELSQSNGTWTETLLHVFTGGKDGENPYAELIADKSGNLYSTTYGGGTHGKGTVFELSPSNGTWTKTVLYNFKGSDGNGPLAGLIFDSTGNLYGTTGRGGASDHGVVFELTPSTKGWSETVLYSFAGAPADGDEPSADLIMDGTGNIYSTTRAGGAGTACRNGCGTVFELISSNGTWTESVLYSFSGKPDGATPFAGLIFDQSGNLYGTTDTGGEKNDGVIFELTPSNGTWTESTVYSFRGWPRDGARSYANLISDGQGGFYGATIFGGANDPGVIFQFTP
jgi:uncharacterized repeat protein (TIGR03803 family)